MTEKHIVFPPRHPATREEFFIRTQQAMFRTKEVLDKITPVADAENAYLERVAREMGIEKYHLK